ncbi:hypothetical protein M3Y99_01688200 [Aphelenchoides fujianensis]|nr:hypothetical protein M3Y99_01688200 [Aphelenchoides fujianensis]
MTSSALVPHSPQRKSSIPSFHLSYPILLLFLVVGLQNALFFQKARWALRLAEKTHMFVVASFYYKTSKSFAPNTIAIIYAARKHAIDFPITCHSRDAFGQTHQAAATTEMALVAPVQCRWTIMVALCPVVEYPTEFALEGDPGKAQVLPFTPADSTPRRFAVCMSRMFLFENWQLLISSLEIYRHYGADLLVTYDATYNSCLYEFKDSAEFILIADWDDVLVPNGHDNYTFWNRTSFLPGEDAERSFIRFVERNNLTHTFLNLPDSFPYYEQLIECYHRMITLLDHNSLNACPSLPKCNLQVKSNHSCINLEQHYESSNLLNGFVLHYSSFNDYVETQDSCRTYSS